MASERVKEMSGAGDGGPDLCSPQYSAFTQRRKNLILFLISFAASFSPLSSFIFFPAISAMSQSLDVSVARVNLTITSYMVVSGIAPALLGDLADNVGRRIVYLGIMVVYCAANVGLALQRSWIALFLLRMLQSSGSAATIALGYGVVSDLAPPAERGGYVSGMVLGPNIATAVGPILGGALADYLGWWWIFWLLSLLSGTCLTLLIFFLPETARSIVGDGSVTVSALRRTLYSYFQRPKAPSPAADIHELQAEPLASPGNPTPKSFRFPNPLLSLKLLWAKDTALITLIFGIFYMNLSSLQASTSTLFIDLYGVSDIQAGLVYLPSGIGSCIGAYGAGALLDHDYRVIARKHDISIDARGDDLADFPIEKARFRSIWYMISLSGIGMVGYGWALASGVNMAVPLVLQFTIGLGTAVIFNMCGTLLVDLHPTSPSTVQAANSLIRAFLAGGGTAFVQPLLDTIGIGWTFTFFGALCFGCLGLAWSEWRCGEDWRDAMRRKGIER